MNRTITLRRLWLLTLRTALIALLGAAFGLWGGETAIPAIYFTLMMATIATIAA